MRTQDLFKFIQERHAIYTRRTAGQPKPWTKDPILQRYRFCNAYRELDTVTQWIAKNWRTPNYRDPNIWFAMTVARMFNLPSTLAAIGYPVPFKPEHIRRVVNGLRAKGVTTFSAAYMIRCDIQSPGKTKVDYLVDKVFPPMWKARKDVPTGSLSNFHHWLMGFYGMGSFMAGQVIADVKHTEMLCDALDWNKWAAPGPGSVRGMSRVEFDDVNTSYTPEEWSDSLAELHQKIKPLFAKVEMPWLHAQDLQNCLCEFDKYERVRLGEGRPKQLYPGNA